LGWIAGLAMGWLGGLQAQWTTQVIRLQPGFNPVHVQVMPVDPRCDAILAGIPGVSEAWMYNRYIQTTTFTTDPASAGGEQDHWLTWYPSGSPKAFLSTLSQLRGGQAYLIKMASNAAPVTLTLRGIPVPPRADWIPDDFVMSGFPTTESAPVTFARFLRDSPQVSAAPGRDSQVFTVNPATAFQTQVRNPELTTIQPGRAYWAYLKGHSHNPFPVEVVAAGENNAVQFLQDRPIALMTVANTTSQATEVVRLIARESEPPPEGRPRKAGPTPLVALLPQADGTYSARRLAEGVELTLAPGERKVVRLGLVTRELATTRETNATYQGLIEVTEAAHGYRQLVAVVAEVPGSKLMAGSGSLLGTPGARPRFASTGGAGDAGTTTSAGAGLWLGTLTLNAVNNPAFAPTDTPDLAQFPVQPATPLDVRVLLHVNAAGEARLLQKVYLAEVSDGTNRVTRMYGNTGSLPAGAVLRSRVSAPAWPNAAPALLAGTLGSTLATTLVHPFNDPSNPFVHPYHPDHNNLSEDYATSLKAGVESFTITRNLTFYFGSTARLGEGTFQPSTPPLKFTGVTGESVKLGAFSNTPAFSIQCWVNVPKLQQSGATLVLLTNSATGTQARLGFVANTGTLSLTVRNATNSAGTVTSDAPVPVGSWVNVVATYDGTSGSLFLQGNRVANGYLPTLASGAWDAAWLGNTGTNTPSLLGSLHEVVVRNGSLSLQSVPQVMQVPQAMNSSSIVLSAVGSAVNTNVVVTGSANPSVTVSGPSIIDVAGAPAVPAWTQGTAQGLYQETLSGLRRQAITLQGYFQLTRISNDSTLTP
jgi:hypothetical protein